jgi:hypothetical protein
MRVGLLLESKNLKIFGVNFSSSFFSSRLVHLLSWKRVCRIWWDRETGWAANDVILPFSVTWKTWRKWKCKREKEGSSLLWLMRIVMSYFLPARLSGIHILFLTPLQDFSFSFPVEVTWGCSSFRETRDEMRVENEPDLKEREMRKRITFLWVFVSVGFNRNKRQHLQSPNSA